MKGLGQRSKATFDTTSSNEEKELKSFVDELFFLTVAKRQVIGPPSLTFQKHSTGVSGKSIRSVGRLAKAIKQLKPDSRAVTEDRAANT
jgi:hypothetical protein